MEYGVLKMIEMYQLILGRNNQGLIFQYHIISIIIIIILTEIIFFKLKTSMDKIFDLKYPYNFFDILQYKALSFIIFLFILIIVLGFIDIVQLICENFKTFMSWVGVILMILIYILINKYIINNKYKSKVKK
jgi:hypothetical protein